MHLPNLDPNIVGVLCQALQSSRMIIIHLRGCSSTKVGVKYAKKMRTAINNFKGGAFYSMITADQIRAARALLRWSAKHLADKTGVSLNTIQRMEAAIGVPRGLAKNLEAVQEALIR